jgi:hypothetical protein
MAEVDVEMADAIAIGLDHPARLGEHVGRVVGHDVADAVEVVEVAVLADRRERVEPHARLGAVADAELVRDVFPYRWDRTGPSRRDEEETGPPR